jgi:hypothetical protein
MNSRTISDFGRSSSISGSAARELRMRAVVVQDKARAARFGGSTKAVASGRTVNERPLTDLPMRANSFNDAKLP